MIHDKKGWRGFVKTLKPLQPTTLSYGKAGMNYADYTWLAGWNGYELRAVAKTQFAQASHSHSEYAASNHSHSNVNGAFLIGHGTAGIAGTGTTNSWFKACSISITSQYGSGHVLGEFTGGNGDDARSKIYCKFYFRMKQQDAMSSQPTHEVLILDSFGIYPNDMKTVLRTNTTSSKVVELWIHVANAAYIFYVVSYIHYSGSVDFHNYAYSSLVAESSIGGVASNYGSYYETNGIASRNQYYANWYMGSHGYNYWYSNYSHSSDTVNPKKILTIDNYDSYSHIYPGSDNTSYLGSSSYRWKQIYAGTATISTSDRREKKEISYIGNESEFLSTSYNDDKLIQLMMGLKPVVYKFINNDSNRPHHGLIAQDFEKLLQELNLDHAAFIKSPETEKIEEKDDKGNIINVYSKTKENGEYKYGLRYEEFISDLIRFTQILYERIEILENKIRD